ncbi:hypothetical protein Holit_02640 [Hollandina sp. SP2]
MKEQKPHAREFVIRYRVIQIKVEQSKILDDFISAISSNRKYAMGILWGEEVTPPPERETGQGIISRAGTKEGLYIELGSGYHRLRGQMLRLVQGYVRSE